MGSKKKNNGSGNGSKNNKGDGELITDPRFASVHSDPRFQTAPKHKSKVVIDSRFDKMFKDPRFSSENTRIDKRGKRKQEVPRNRLKDYYRIEDGEDREGKKKVEKEDVESDEEEDEKRSKTAKRKEVEIHDDSDDDEEDEQEEEQKKRRSKKVKVEKESEPPAFELKSKKELSESELESDDNDDNDDDDGAVKYDGSSTSSTDSDEEDDDFSEEETVLPEEDVPNIDKETHRLAIVNMDWCQVKAVDLFVLLNSFLPGGGQIVSVTVYPSEFGLKRMEEEAVRGPVGLFDDEDKKGSDEDDDDDDDEFDNEKLRAYEISRLKYYFAVVDCDSVATADHLYKTCDGLEFELSSNKLDLRFIPDSMEFKQEPRDVSTEVPPSYDGIDFCTRALQQSKLQLTWDEDEPDRSRILNRTFTDEQLAGMEQYLASHDTESDEEDSDNPAEDKAEGKQKKKDMYKSLVQSGGGSEDEEDDEKQEMEVTFNTELEDISKRILEKKDRKSESTWEAFQREKKERKKLRKNKRKDNSSDDDLYDDSDREPGEQPDDFFIGEEPATVSKKAKAKKVKLDEDAADSKAKAELELLLDDGNGEETNLKGYNLKRKKGKGKKGKESLDEEKIPTVDYEDPRFSSLFTDPEFAIDPTDPQFKRSAAYKRQIAQKQQKADRDEIERKEGKKLPTEIRLDEPEAVKEQLKSDDASSRKDKHELSSLVKSLKMKSKQVPLPSKVSKIVSGKRGKRSF
jgi:hypothetical protein